MLKQNRSETDDLHQTIAAKDAELITERNQRLQLEEQLRQQIDNQKRLEDIHAIDNKTKSEEKFQKLHKEYLAILHRENELKKQYTDLNQQFIKYKEDQNKKEHENSEKFMNEILQLRQTNDELQDRIQVLTTERNDYQSITINTNERIKQIEYAKQNIEERYKELENDKTRLHKDKSLYEEKLKETEGAHRDLFDKNREHEENLIDLIHEREILEEKIFDLEQTTRQWAQKYLDITDKQKLMQINHENLLNNIKRQYKYSILTYCINQMYDGMDQKQKDIELLNGTEYLLKKLQIAILTTKKLQELWKKQNQSDENIILLFLNECITLANCITDIVIHGKNISNLNEDCRNVTNYCIDLYTNYQTSSISNDDDDKRSNELINRLNLLIEKTKKSRS